MVKYTDILTMIENNEVSVCSRLDEVNGIDARQVMLVETEGNANVSLVFTHKKSNLMFLVGVFFYYSYVSPYQYTRDNGGTVIEHSGLNAHIKSPASISVFGDTNIIDNEYDLAIELLKIKPITNMILKAVHLRLKWYKATIKDVELNSSCIADDKYLEFFNITFKLESSGEAQGEHKEQLIFQHPIKEKEYRGKRFLALLTYATGLHGVNQYEFPTALKNKTLYIRLYKGMLSSFAKYKYKDNPVWLYDTTAQQYLEAVPPTEHNQ